MSVTNERILHEKSERLVTKFATRKHFKFQQPLDFVKVTS